MTVAMTAIWSSCLKWTVVSHSPFDGALLPSLPSIESIPLQVQLRWAGHVSRMEDVRMPKAVFFSHLQEGKRDRGAARKRYKDQLKRQLARAGISHQ